MCSKDAIAKNLKHAHNDDNDARDTTQPHDTKLKIA